MSEIRATTISDAAGTGPITLTGQSAAKAWVDFDQSTGLVVNNSLNISSSVDIAGAYSSHNLTNSYANLFYTTLAGGANGRSQTSYFEAEAYTKDAGTFYVYGHWQTTAYDLLSVCAVTHGDLA